LLRGGRLGLITHPAAVTAKLTPAPEALLKAGARVVALFGPEHGVRGAAPDGEPVADAVDPVSGLPEHSLYGRTRRPTPEALAGLDALVYDLQDVGARCYTFISTLSLAMEAAAERHLPLIVLDRPNPLGGAAEGPMLEPAQQSFLGRHPLPLRYGLTAGEFALTAHRLWGVGEPPEVLPMSAWRRERLWGDLGRAWVPPSPNQPTAAAALLYPSTVLLEGTNISEGRGTTQPFLQAGAPWLEGRALAAALNGEALPGLRWRPVHFRPACSKFAGELCSGVAAHVLKPAAVESVAAGVALLAAIRAQHPEAFQWRRSGEDFAVDRLAGVSALRLALDAGESPPAIAATWKAGCREFLAAATRLEAYA